jgi:hypothetical protein
MNGVATTSTAALWNYHGSHRGSIGDLGRFISARPAGERIARQVSPGPSARRRLRNHMAGGPPQTASIEVHFAWVLDGRAVQDTWITSSSADRAAGRTAPLHWFGTTLRVFDRATGSWRATWTDPESSVRIDLDGRRRGDDIVQIGTRGGHPIRWSFTKITADAFLWQGHILHTDGSTWRLEVEVVLRRARAG